MTGISKEELRSAVRLLIKYSMVNGERKQSVLSVHKLVQEVTRVSLEEGGKSEEVMDETFKLLRASFPYSSNRLEDYLKKRELLPHLEAFLSHIDNWFKKNPKDKEKIEKDYLENLLIWMSDGYFNFGNPKREKELLERALPILEKHYEKDRFKVAKTLTNLSNTYIALGDYKGAKTLLERTLKIEKEDYGENHFEVANTLVNLSITYVALGDYQEAKDLLEKALTILEKHYDKNPLQVAKILVNLSSTYRAMNYYQGAKNLLESALSILEKHSGKDTSQVVMVLVNLSTDHQHLGNYQEAKELLERALPILKKHYGEDSFQVVTVLENLGISYIALGDYQKAKKMLEKALPILKKHYGEDNLLLAMPLVDLSACYEHLGDYQKAKEMLERVLSILENHHYFPRHLIVKDVSQDLLKLSIYISAGEGNFDLVRKLIEEDNVFARSDSDTILYQAISSDNKKVIRLILEKIKEKDSQNFSKHINAKNTEGDTPLIWATQNGRTNAAEILLEYGADPNIRDNNGKTPLDLAKEKSALDPENDNFKVITALLLSVTDEFQYREEQRAILLEECLPSTSSGRNKREAKIGECELSWKDVDKFNTEKDEKRDFSKIKVDSERFIDYIKDLPEKKRSQLIELADKVQVKGRFSNLVNKLTSNQKVMNHLNRVKKISSITMHGMMAKNVLADFLNRDYQGIAINVGFIAGGQGFAKVAEAASLKGMKLASEGKLLLSKSLIAASPFLARGTSAFVVYDLVNQIKAFKNGTEGALVGVVGDSIYLGVDAAEIGIEIAEGFEVLEGVSSITGPIGGVVGTAAFIYTDIYMTVKIVDKIDEIIYLTRGEKFIEGLRAFIGMRPEQYIEELIEEKQLYNQLVKQGFEYLKGHSDIQSYVFPTSKSVVDSCRTVTHTIPLGIMHYYTEECTTKFEMDLDSKVLLDRKRTDIKWRRARPDNPSGGKLFCLPQGDDEPAPSYGSYLCESAIGISANKTGNHTLINLGKGKDYAKGFKNSPNIFVVNDGSKEYYGGNKDDIFVLQGDLIEGFLYGEDGIDTLDLTEFAQEDVNVNVYLNGNTGTIVYKHHEYHAFKIDSVERVLGRKAKSERIFSTCYTKFLDGQGGAKNDSDIITINNNDCTHKMQIIVRPNTVVYNRALEGSFDYLVPFNGSGSADLSFIYEPERFNVNNTFWFAYEPANIKSIDVKYINVFNRTKHKVKFSFIESDKEFNVTIFYPENPSYRLENNGEIRIGNKDNLYMLQSSNESAEEIIKNYLPIANRLNKMSFFIQSLLSNETVVIGSGNHEVIHNNPAYKSHLVGNGGENIYVIDSNETYKFPEVIIHDIDEENSIDTIDLRSVVKKAKDSFELQVIKFENDLLLRATVEKQKDEYFTVKLKDGVERYNKTHVIVENAPMIINFDNNQWSLKPQPLIFEKDKEIIVVMGQDVEKGTELIIPRKGGNYKFVRSNSNDLMITNAFDSTITKDDLCSITLSKFYKTPKMKTLSIKFVDKEIVLKDHEKEISTARDVSVVEKEHKDQVYNGVFNHTKSSPEVIDQPHKHRHEHSRQHIRNRRSEYTMSSGTRRSSWINDLFGWVKSSVSRLLGSRAALPETSANYSNTSGTSQFSSEVCISNNVDLGFFLLQSFLDKKYPLPKFSSITPQDALADTLNIMEEFKKTLKKTAKQFGVSVKGFDFFKVYSDIAGYVRNERYSKIPSTLYSAAEEAYPENEKFLSILKGNIEKMFDKQQIVNSGYQPNDIADNKPRSYFNNTTVEKQLYHAISS